jgi:two-component system chemotaxis response regulator CheY
MKVMIVDDSSFIVLVCRHALEKAGYDVVGEAYDGIDAVQMAQDEKPDFIIMDMALPRMSGIEATELIKQFLPEVKILAVSAIDETWLVEKSKRVGCFDFLAKPFEAKELIAIVESQKPEEELKYG